jgi:hypothetical protein
VPVGWGARGPPPTPMMGERRPPFSVTSDGRVLLRTGRQFGVSPSAVATFERCPLLFRYRHIDRLPEAATPELTSGILVHEVLADLFDLPPQQRTLDAAQAAFRERWTVQRRSARYAPLRSSPWAKHVAPISPSPTRSLIASHAPPPGTLLSSASARAPRARQARALAGRTETSSASACGAFEHSRRYVRTSSWRARRPSPHSRSKRE